MISVGYVRVSTDDQDTGLQKILIEAELPDRTFEDIESGSVRDRPEYQELKTLISAGEVSQLIVYKLDRLGRDPLELLLFFNLLEQHNVEFMSCTEPFLKDWNSTPIGYLIWWQMVGFSKFEILQLKQRQRAGIDAARARGVHLGRPRKHE